MKNSCYLYVVLLFLCGTPLRAQQSVRTNLYPQNYYLINAAAAGNGDSWEIWTGYRNQWTAVKNAPTQAYLNAQGRLGKRNGMGISIGQAKEGLLSTLNGKLSFAYHLPVSARGVLHAGASVGIGRRQFNVSGVVATDYSDDVLQGNQSVTAYNTDVGLMFTTPRFHVGIAAIQLLHENAFTREDDANLLDYMIVHGSYTIAANDTWQLQGIAAYRRSSSNGQKQQADIGSRFLWKERYGMGAGYRTDDGLFLRGEWTMNNTISLGYCYETGSSRTMKSHEVMIGIKLRGKEQPRQKDALEETRKPDLESNLEPESKSEPKFEPEPEPISEVTQQDSTGRRAASVPVNKKDQTIDLDSLNSAFARSDKLIMFELNSSDKILSGNQGSVLDKVVEILNENPALNVIIAGHSCTLGSVELNQEISEARAKEVAMALQGKGISPFSIKYLGKGETEPVTTGTSPRELAKNRRVQIMFSFKNIE